MMLKEKFEPVLASPGPHLKTYTQPEPAFSGELEEKEKVCLIACIIVQRGSMRGVSAPPSE